MRTSKLSDYYAGLYEKLKRNYMMSANWLNLLDCERLLAAEYWKRESL